LPIDRSKLFRNTSAAINRNRRPAPEMHSYIRGTYLRGNYPFKRIGAFLLWGWLLHSSHTSTTYQGNYFMPSSPQTPTTYQGDLCHLWYCLYWVVFRFLLLWRKTFALLSLSVGRAWCGLVFYSKLTLFHALSLC